MHFRVRVEASMGAQCGERYPVGVDEHLRGLEREASRGDVEAEARFQRERARSGQGRFAIISDVHGNLEALTAVLEDVAQLGIEEIICLGDMVGFGPNPLECVDLVMERCSVTLLGDQEETLLRGFKGGFVMNRHAEGAIRWMVDLLQPRSFGGVDRRPRWAFLEALPLEHRVGPDLFVHGSPRQPTTEYVLREEVEWGHSQKFEEIFAAVERTLFVGHSHSPLLITEDLEAMTPSELDHTFEVQDGRKAILNVGSVGQPRDRDPRACYVTVEGRRVTWRRVEYDVERTAAKIRDTAALTPDLALRLVRGL
jgi:diadenosine tetraphosphatase ApaH/serine/threonine PP2A family protein phosphatase